MEPHDVERRLVAILSADVKGYSRLMGEDEVATVRTLTAHREVMATLIQQYRGEVVGSPGDNLLALFPSVVGAVQCTVEIQRELKIRNAELPAHRKVEFRIGINLGDVIVQGTDIHGDGVNIAARLEGLAEAGGICISGIVYEQIKNKLALRYEYLGEQTLKNIAEPVPVYRVQMGPGAAAPTVKEKRGDLPPPCPPSVRRLGLIGGIALGVLVLVLLFLFRGSLTPEALPLLGKRGESRSKGQLQAKAVGVMPFRVVGADPQLEWMREAIRDHFNSQLSHVSDLKVYSKEYIDFLVQRGSSTEIEVANRLNIAKMISGSFLAVGNRLRIEAHIIDVQSGLLEVSDSVEGELSDFFTLHRQLALKITDRLNVVVAAGEKGVVASGSSAPSLDTYKMLLEAEGETKPAGFPKGENAPSQGSPRQEKDKHSRVPLGWGWPSTGVAWAGEAPPQGVTPEEEVRKVLEQYRQAYEKKDLTLLEDVYQTLTPAQREANMKYFQNAQDLRVTISDVDIAVKGDEAAVSYNREDQFIDAKTGKNVKLDVRFTKIFMRTDGAWKIVVGKK